MSFQPERDAIVALLDAHGRGLADAWAQLRVQAPPVRYRGAPRRCVWRDGSRCLYRYDPEPATTVGAGSDSVPPLLMVYAMVNRPRILDLTAERSLIRELKKRGQTVYLLDWGRPRRDDWAQDFNDHAITALGRAIDAVVTDSGHARVVLLGVCQGGVMALCRAMAAPQQLAGLITSVTPVDFQVPGDRLSALVRRIDTGLLKDSGRTISGGMLRQLFLALKPVALGHGKYIDLARSLRDPARLNDFLEMESWIADSPDQPSAVMSEFLELFYQRNSLVKGTLELGGRALNLSELRLPILNIYATDDHIVPPAASRALADCVPASRYEELAVRGGHIGLYVGRGALTRVPQAVRDFCGQVAGA